MHIKLRVLSALIIGVLLVSSAMFQPSAQVDDARQPEIVGEGDQLEFLADRNLAIYRGNVRIEYRDVTLFADEVSLNRESMDVEAVGNVRIVHGEAEAMGDHATGNLDTNEFEFSSFTGHYDEWLIKGSGAERYGDGRLVVRNAAMTTCEDWWVHASEVERLPNGDYVARNVTFRVGGVPLLWLPRISGNTSDRNSRWSWRGGHQSNWGFFAQVSRTWDLGELGETEFALIYRTKRGFGLQNETTLQTTNSETFLHAYGMVDEDPLSDRKVGSRDYNNRYKSEEERYRLRLYHRQTLADELTFRGNVDLISDNDLLLEFYRQQYNDYPEPASFANLTLMRERYIVSGHLRAQVNDFFTTVERLPEIRLDMPRQELFAGLHYQGATSIARLRTTWRDYDLARDDGARLDDYDSWRFDTLHMLYYPLQLDWLTIVPRAGFRYTYYDDSSRQPVSDFELEQNFAADDRRAEPWETSPMFNFDDQGGSLGRTLFELGTQISFKSARTWQNYENRAWDLDGLRHVVEPYLNYTYITDPNRREHIYYFDQVDRIPETHLIRIGVEQRLQTRREQRIYTLVRLENYVDFHFDPQEAGLDEKGEIGTKLSVHPHKSFSFWVDSLVDYDSWRMNMLDVGTAYHFRDRWSAGVSYLLRNDYRSRYITSMGSDLTEIISETIPHTYNENHNIQLRFRLYITPSLQFQTAHYIDLEAGELGRQIYELSRHTDCWITALRLEEDGDEVRIVLMVTLKDIGRLRTGG